MQEIGCAGLDPSHLQVLVECLLKVLIQIAAIPQTFALITDDYGTIIFD